MRILIGGSPSTGSSVFRQILNRHPQIFCGPETSLFCYPELYQRWISARRRILLPSRLNLHKVDVRVLRGVRFDDDEFGWSRQELRRLIGSHTSLPGFSEAFFARPLQRNEKLHWAEKTPGNVLMFPHFTSFFDEAYIIHTIRNPYDTVASMVARGMSAYEAASVYLLYTAHGLAVKKSSGYIECRYEALVNDPASEMQEVLHPLGLEFYSHMLSAGNPQTSGVTKMLGWQLDELAPVSDQSVSRFEKSPERLQVNIATALAMVRLTDAYLTHHHLYHNKIESICHDLNYPFRNERDMVDTTLFEELKKQRQQVMRRLWIYNLFSSTSKGYSVELSSNPF